MNDGGFFLEPVTTSFFIVLKDFRLVKLSDWRGVPGGEYLFVFANDGD